MHSTQLVAAHGKVSSDFQRIWMQTRETNLRKAGYLSSINRYGDMQPDHLAAFDFGSHLPGLILTQRSEQISLGF